MILQKGWCLLFLFEVVQIEYQGLLQHLYTEAEKRVSSNALDLFCGVMDEDNWARPPPVLRLKKGGVFGLKACMWLLLLKIASSELWPQRLH